MNDPADAADLGALVGALPLADKVRLLTGASTFTLGEEPRIGLRATAFSDGPTGVRGLRFDGGVVTLLPNATLLASSWSEEVAAEVGAILAEEAQVQDIHVVLGPTINLHRTALGGRLFEAYSEDPLLSGRLAAAYVVGMQERGVGACLKHLVANESETERTTVSSVVDEATLREVYLLPFEIAVQDAHPWSVMAAYNDVNGTPATEHHHVISEVLKDEWGWDGLLMSDWFATKSAGPAANAGLDLVMPGPDGPWGDALVAAVESGEVAESVVEEHLRRLLRLATRVGTLGEAHRTPEDLPTPEDDVRREQMTRLATAGITVLTNTDEVLPLRRDGSVALVGRHAGSTVVMGGGSAKVTPPHQVSVAEGLHALLGERVTVVDGVGVRSRPVPVADGMMVLPGSEDPGVEIVLLDADGEVLDTRRPAVASTVTGFDDDLPRPAARMTMRAVSTCEGKVELSVSGAGSWTLRAGEQETSVELRQAGGLPGEDIFAPPHHEWVVRLEHGTEVVAEVRWDREGGGLGGGGTGLYSLAARRPDRSTAEVLAAAASAAAAADVAVVVVGLTDEQETEAVDKTTLALPGDQDALVSAVAAAARRTVVVVNAATPVLMPWLDDVDAVLWVGLPGQEGGHAVAAALLGDREPAGRLVTSFPAADGAAPAWDVVPVAGEVVYAEGAFLGYRGHHAGRAPAPAFWLGHGLGYATWEYAEPRLLGTDPVRVGVLVTNTGTRSSREVVQLYWEPGDPDQPVRLVGWTAVQVEPNATEDVTVEGDPRLWRRWDTATHAWDVLPPSGRLLLARGLGDIRGELPLDRPTG